MEVKSVTWFTKKDGKTDRIQVMRENEKPVPENLDWKKSFVTITGEEKLNWFEMDAEGNITRRVTDEEYLKREGKEDPRCEYFDKERKLSNKHIYDIDSLPPEGFTKEPPIENEAFQNWNEKKKKWEVDTEKKAIADKEAELGRLKSEIAEVERKRLRSEFAIRDNEATEDDLNYNADYKAQIKTLRPQITKAEAELKKLKSA